LASVLAAAVVVFVVSLSVALGLGLTPDTDSTVAQRDTAVSTDQPARMPTAPSVAQAVPRPIPVAPPPPAAPPPDARRLVAETIEVAAAPVAEPPAALPPAPAYVPPAPAYVPPAPPPNYIPPAPPPQPRLRDRIIERIPIINRFHEPNPYG
jgi:hypothetical protein